MSEEEFIIKFYSCDNEEQFLKDVYHNLNRLQQENQHLKEMLERINNYLDKNYAADNQYYFDHIQDIIKER